jgi:poly(A) polymerase
VGEPTARFREDPLRILRGLRFASQLGFEIEERTLAGMRETCALIATLSQERITAELDKLLCGVEPGRGLHGLAAANCLEVVLPEVATMVGCEQNSFHQFDVWEHTVATVEAIETTPESLRIRRWTAFLHDLGKPAVRHRKANGEWGFYRHETVGAELAEGLLERLRMNRAEARLIALLVRRHMDRPDPADARSVRRFMAKTPDHWRDLIALKRADNRSHTYMDDGYHDALNEACERVERDESARLRAESPLTGDELVALFDRSPGPWIRAVKEHLSSMVLDGELAPGEKAAAERAAKSMLRRSRS